MASNVGFEIDSIINDSINRAFCLEDTDKFPIKSYVPKLMPKFDLDTPKEWDERINLSFIKNSNFQFNRNEVITLKNYIDIHLDYDNLIFEDFEKGDNLEFKFKDHNVKKLYLKNRRSFDKEKDKVVLFANDSSSYNDSNSRYHLTIDSKNGNIIIETSNNTYQGSKKSIILDQQKGTITISNGNSGLTLDGTNVIVHGNLIFNNGEGGSDNDSDDDEVYRK